MYVQYDRYLYIVKLHKINLSSGFKRKKLFFAKFMKHFTETCYKLQLHQEVFKNESGCKQGEVLDKMFTNVKLRIIVQLHNYFNAMRFHQEFFFSLSNSHKIMNFMGKKHRVEILKLLCLTI